MRSLALLPATLAALLLALALPGAQAQDADTVDLRLRLDLHETEVHAGDLISMGFNVTNAGPATATGVTVTLVMPEGATFEDGHRCSSNDGRVAVCSGEDLSMGSFIGYSFHVRFHEAGEKTIMGTVHADQPDSDLADNEDEITVDVQEARPNPAPQGLQCQADASGITVSWGVNDFVQEYRVYRAVGEEGEAVLVWRGVEQSYRDADVEPGTVYRYEVSAMREHGESERATCVVTAVPEFPGMLAAAAVGVAALGAFVVLRRRRRRS